MMEAKLRQMESTNPVPKPKAAPPSTSHDKDIEMDDTTHPFPSSPPKTSSLPHHPSLPMKPPPPLPKHLSIEPPSRPNSRQGGANSKPAAVLPTLTMLQSAAKATKANPLLDAKPLGLKPTLKAVSSPHSGTSAQGLQRAGKPTKLIGVKIKAKEKGQP